MMSTTRKPQQETDDEPAKRAADWRRMTAAAHDKIADRAHRLYEERGRESGHDLEDWLKAEHDIEEGDSTE